MKILIPHNAVVMLMGAAGSGKTSFAHLCFPPHQILASDYLREVVSDDASSMEASKDAFEILHKLLEMRVSRDLVTVVDATNLRASARKEIRSIAKLAAVPVVLIAIEASEELCQRMNSGRERIVPPEVITKHVHQFKQALDLVPNEGYHSVYVIRQDERGTVEVVVAENGERNDTGWDIIADVHGCLAELMELIRALGYTVRATKDGVLSYTHPDGRKLAFVGDFVDRGPQSRLVLLFVEHLIASGVAVAVRGNHDDKLLRYLKGRNVVVKTAMQATLDEFTKADATEEEMEGHKAFLASLPYQRRLLVAGAPDLILVHAGIPKRYVDDYRRDANQHCLYGETSGFHSNGYPIRTYGWHNTWKSGPNEPVIVHGHDVVDELVDAASNVINIDNGCVFGRHLVAYRWPERRYFAVQAHAKYAEREVSPNAD